MNNRIKHLRKDYLKMTQSEFAKSLDMSRSNIGNIESGVVDLTERNINLICEKHNINKHWIKSGEGEVFKKLSLDDEFDILVGKLYAENDAFKKNIIRAMLKLDDEDWKLVKKFTEEFKRGI